MLLLVVQLDYLQKKIENMLNDCYKYAATAIMLIPVSALVVVVAMAVLLRQQTHQQ
jgi:hypothetical protein